MDSLSLSHRSRTSNQTVLDDSKVDIVPVDPPVLNKKEGVMIKDDTGHFTFRASITGSLLGCLVAASNFYLGLKAGWTFGAQLFSAIFSFALLKTISKLTGSYFGPEENCTAQTAASTTGGLSVGFITGIPAMYRLGLMSGDVMSDLGRLVMWTIAASSYGLFFAVPLRKHFVINNDLPFPTPRATAVTIKTLHNTVEKQKEALDVVKVMGATFGASLVQSIASHWVYFLDKIHIFYWIGHAANHTGLQTADTTWGWHFVPNFAFFGAGLITPPAILLSFLAGSLIGFGVGGPVMVDNGYLSTPLGWGKKGNGSAQSWWFWPGISLMLFSAFTEVAVHLKWRKIVPDVRDGVGRMVTVVKEKLGRGHGLPVVQKEDRNQEDKDPVPAAFQVPTLWWTGGLAVSAIWTCITLTTTFQIPIYQSLLSILFAFILALIGVQSAAQTDINPISTLAKVVQLAFFKFPANSLQQLQRNDLLSAAVTAAAANQAADMVGDLKTGHIIGASPRSQFLSQLVGTLFAIPVNLTLFIIFAKAYPCIIKPMDTCEFGLSPVLGWENFTLLLTTNTGIPTASWITALVVGLLSIPFIIIRDKHIPAKYHSYLPNLGAIGLGLIVPQPSTPLAMCLAMVAGLVWKKLDSQREAKYRVAVASGGIAGVGVGAVVRAVLKLCEVEEKVVGWNCPLDAKGAVKCL